MFNLLRRTRQRKTHKNKVYDVSDDEEAATTAKTTTQQTRATTSVIGRSTESESENSNSAECRYLFSATESNAAKSQREKANEESSVGPRRAVIEELEDFCSDDNEATDEELESVKLAKTAAAAAAANGHSAISWRSDNLLYINNMGGGNAATTARTTATTVVDEQNDRNVAALAAIAGHGTGSQNEANNEGGQLIGSSSYNIGQTDCHNRIGPIIDGNAQQLQIAGTVINAEATTKTKTETQTTNKETVRDTETVKYRQSKQSTNEQKRLSRLSLGNFASGLHLSNNNNNPNSNTNKDNSNINRDCESESVNKKRKTLQRSREFLTDIFMARGRNHQRQHRNQQQQQQQQPPQQQQQQPVAKSKSAKEDVIAIGQALTTRPTALATAHLETNSDPATVSTNSYQMTMSNNSSTQNRHNAAQQSKQSELKEQEQERRAEGEREREREREQSQSNSAGQEQQQQQLAKESQKQRDGNRDASAEFIQATNVELCTVAEDQQQGDATLQRSRSSSNSSNKNNSNSNSNNNNTSDIIINSMGQTSAKPNEESQQSQSAHSSRASTPREFRESIVSEPQCVPVAPPRHHQRQQQPQQQQQELPTITVVDCSFEASPSQSPQATEVFYDFDRVNIEELNEAHVETLEDEVFATDIPTTIYQQQANIGIARPWTRLTNVKLENVQEEAEEDAEHEPEPEDDELDEALDMECDEAERATPNGSRQSASSERSALKSDSNLSSSYADSGIGHDMQHGSEQRQQQLPQQQQPQVQRMLPLRMPFVRDANSTSTDCDCEEMLLQCDELDDEQQFNERLVCIESISLPDVVVESTTATTTAATAATTAASATAATTAATNGNSDDGHLNINITNGAGGNCLGNVHFIPIHIEGGVAGSASAAARSRSNSPKQRSLDDSCIGRNTIEIVEDSSVLNNSSMQETLELKKELKIQKARFTTQLEDAHRNVQSLESKVSDMQVKIQNLEQELSRKQWNVDRLQGELVAAQKDDEYVRKKLKLLEEEKTHLRHKYSDDEDEFRRKYDALQSQYNELTEKYKETQSLANNLQAQVASAKVEVEDWRNEVNKIRDELEEQIRILKNALEYSEAERKICEDKWQKEFEMLRTHNREREETLMSDCEWQMRQMQRQCKDKMDKSNYERKQASAKAEELELELQSRHKEAEHLRICQAQVKSLSGVVSEQERSIHTLMERIENLKGELETANENLESQIEAVRKIKYQCDNAIYDKERQMIYRIDEVRNEAAAFWENKLYTEMTRLTNELESVYVDERRDALDKLQAEHIEELRALTNRYTANEEELRAEIDELHENLELKKQDFLTLRERSDNALLQTRMHLDRADREYQNAMCREEDRRVELEEKLKKEFETEKEEMEEKFRERLGQVKEEFAKELQLSTQDMVESHRKELETQRAKLQAEKDEALQGLVERHRAKMTAAEERMNDVELRHQRNLKDLKAAYDAEKAALDNRDISNANEIEQLHRKCRCLTNLFEEMRMRYERRDPRPEDLREITELRTRCDSQERDLFVLTDRLREMQIQMSELQQNGGEGALRKKPPSKTIPTSCDVIYEENEERESPEQEREEGEGSSEGDNEEEQLELEPSDTESNHTIEVNQKCINSDRINEDDAHMISAV